MCRILSNSAECFGFFCDEVLIIQIIQYPYREIDMQIHITPREREREIEREREREIFRYLDIYVFNVFMSQGFTSITHNYLMGIIWII